MACFMSLTKHAEVFARSAHSMMEPALQKVDSLIKDWAVQCWERGRPRPQIIWCLKIAITKGSEFALRAHCGRGRPRSQHQVLKWISGQLLGAKPNGIGFAAWCGESLWLSGQATYFFLRLRLGTPGGIASKMKRVTIRKGRAFPHIRRQSRGFLLESLRQLRIE